MSDASLPVEGGCRCGEVRLRVSAPPLLTMACHCTGCQRMSASAFSLSAAIPSEAFEVIQGEPVPGGASPVAGHHFCPRCMSWMFTRPPGMDWFVNLRPTLLDKPRWNRPFVETYTREKLSWAVTPAVHSFPTFPELEAFGPFMAEYRDWAASEAG